MIRLEAEVEIAGQRLRLPFVLDEQALAAIAAAVLPDAGRSAPEWLDVGAAAAHLGISPERIRKLKERRELPCYQAGHGCRVMFRRRELDEWMAQFRQPERKTR